MLNHLTYIEIFTGGRGFFWMNYQIASNVDHEFHFALMYCKQNRSFLKTFQHIVWIGHPRNVKEETKAFHFACIIRSFSAAACYLIETLFSFCVLYENLPSSLHRLNEKLC